VLPTSIKECYIATKLEEDFNRSFGEKLPEGIRLLQIAEDIVIKRVYKEEGFNIARTAKRLGISRPTLYKKIKELNIKL